ncbi:protein FAR1-RELATED SEQUENCE 5-like [Rutidosis leptorrhynchoides]|uniref:protein FAR1-RELATED SEQUENCE 5-like n=1 Tax=Rutidosis leptorrhynchoides TaxID=125765 RepID=UPI003A992904
MSDYNEVEDIEGVEDEGSIFDSIDAGYEFYQRYAQKGSFEIRKSTTKSVSKRQRGVDGPKIVKLKYFVCSRQEFKEQKSNINVLDGNESNKEQSNSTRNVDVNVEANNKQKQKRTRPSQRIGCLASFKLQIRQDDKYELYRFVEEHNHSLVHPDYSLHLKMYRRLDNSMKTMLFNFLMVGIDPTTRHRILKKLFGGHDKVGATLVDFRNWKRDIIQYIGKADAQIIIDMLKNRKETCPNFSFEYFTDDNNILGGFFWTDDHAKRNYSAFGDVISFDATYCSNKYKMVFIPFTGIDNHTKCVTFGAGMLSKENEYSYTWLLNCFKKAFPKEPTIMMTDQDPAMRKAVEEVSKTTRHRLCMWHITEKLTSKVGVKICNSGFKTRFSQIVWTNKLQPHDFKKRWGVSKNDHEECTEHDVADGVTQIEKDAAKIYTQIVFLKLQEEIHAATKHCNSLNFSDSNGIKKYTIVDRSVELHDIHIDESIDGVEKPYEALNPISVNHFFCSSDKTLNIPTDLTV